MDSKYVCSGNDVANTHMRVMLRVCTCVLVKAYFNLQTLQLMTSICSEISAELYIDISPYEYMRKYYIYKRI